MKIKKICKQCGREFEAIIYPRSGGLSRVTCSKECRYKLPNLRRTGKYINCKICGKSFYVPNYRIKAGAKFCNMKCKRRGQKGFIPWNKRSKEDLDKIKLILKETLSCKKTAKLLGMTTSAVSTANFKHLKINCHKGWAKYPRWTKEEDKFAINFLKKNPDLRCLAKEIAKKRGVILTKRFRYHIKNRSANIWKLNLKKIRANKELNETMFKKGLNPWNKNKKLPKIMHEKIIKQRREQWNNDQIVYRFFRGQYLKYMPNKKLTKLDKEIIRTRVQLFKIQRKEVKTDETNRI